MELFVNIACYAVAVLLACALLCWLVCVMVLPVALFVVKDWPRVLFCRDATATRSSISPHCWRKGAALSP